MSLPVRGDARSRTLPLDSQRTNRTEAVEASVVELTRGVRLRGGGLGIVVVASAVVLFLAPEQMIGVMPWAISSLTVRVLTD